MSHPAGSLTMTCVIFGLSPATRQALLPAHARPHHDERLAVPIGPAREIFHGPVVRQIHLQEVVLVPVFAADRLVVLELLGSAS